MRVIPVLDLKGGHAVLAHRGLRDSYAPVRSVLVPEERAGDALALALAFRDGLGCDECYVADLDAIRGGPAHEALLGALARVGLRLLVDAGVASAGAAEELVAGGAARVVVGLETLPSFAALREIVRAVGADRVVFSLDLRAGRPVRLPGAAPHGAPTELVRLAVEAGAAKILVLDLARIGSGLGVDRSLLAALRHAHPAVELLAGGGVGSTRHLEQVAEAGCNAALVATALHDGRLTRRDIEAVRRRGAASRELHSSDSR